MMPSTPSIAPSFHWFGPANRLLGRLKDKFHVASQFSASFAQNIGDGQRNRGMPIVPTRVHPAIDGGTIIDFSQLMNRQSIHIGANRDRFGAGFVRLTA